MVADNLRLSAERPGPEWANRQLLHAVALETIVVRPTFWRCGVCKRFIQRLVADDRYELVVVEGVLNAHLYEALLRWDWHLDPGISDFYWPKSEAARAAVARLDRSVEERENVRRRRHSLRAEARGFEGLDWSDGL